MSLTLLHVYIFHKNVSIAGQARIPPPSLTTPLLAKLCDYLARLYSKQTLLYNTAANVCVHVAKRSVEQSINILVQCNRYVSNIWC